MNINELKKQIQNLLESEERTLYVCRHVKNAEEILDWFHDQGLEDLLSPEDLHVTIAYSSEPLNWDNVPDSFDDVIVPKSEEYRTVSKLGNAIVLKFKSQELTDRWNEIRKAGASWDYDGYQPHVSLIYLDDDDEDVKFDMSKIEPYTGAIELGPESFEELKED